MTDLLSETESIFLKQQRDLKNCIYIFKHNYIKTCLELCLKKILKTNKYRDKFKLVQIY